MFHSDIYDETRRLIYHEIALEIISTLCSILQNQAALKRAKFSRLKTNKKVSYVRKNNLVFDEGGKGYFVKRDLPYFFTKFLHVNLEYSLA